MEQQCKDHCVLFSQSTHQVEQEDQLPTEKGFKRIKKEKSKRKLPRGQKKLRNREKNRN
jgi:hypothetical protein